MGWGISIGKEKNRSLTGMFLLPGCGASIPSFSGGIVVLQEKSNVFKTA
jgi:hypothetical protein